MPCDELTSYRARRPSVQVQVSEPAPLPPPQLAYIAPHKNPSKQVPVPAHVSPMPRDELAYANARQASKLVEAEPAPAPKPVLARGAPHKVPSKQMPLPPVEVPVPRNELIAAHARRASAQLPAEPVPSAVPVHARAAPQKRPSKQLPAPVPEAPVPKDELRTAHGRRASKQMQAEKAPSPQPVHAKAAPRRAPSKQVPPPVRSPPPPAELRGENPRRASV